MIEDKELRNLFRSESEEHIQQLEQGFLHLEKKPGDKAMLDEVMREAHSLKGAARMLGLEQIEKLSHCLEDTFRAATQGTFALDLPWMDKLYTGLDAIKALVEEAVSGTVAGVDISAVLDVLNRKIETSVKPEQEKKSIVQATTGPAPLDTAEEIHTRDHRLKTIRVHPRQLDDLMTQSGELIVTKTGIDQRLRQMEDLNARWQELIRRRSLAKGNGVGELDSASHAAELLEQSLSDDFSLQLEQIYNSMYEDNTRLDAVAAKLDQDIRRIRMLPLSTLFNLFPRMVRDISSELSKNIELIIEGGDTTADKRIIEEMKDPLMHIIRNAINHGIETPAERKHLDKPSHGTITLRGYQTSASVIIEVGDDGHGLNLEKIKAAAIKRQLYGQEELSSMTARQLQSLIFMSGLSTQEMITDISGRGVGLDVVRNNVEGMKGQIEVDSWAQQGCTVRAVLPLTMATTRVMLVQVDGRPYGIPVEFLVTSIRLKPDALFSVEGRQTALIDGEAVSVEFLTSLLELPGHETEESSKTPRYFYCVVVQSDGEQLGLLVDAAVDVQEVVLKSAGAMLNRVRNVAGSTILGNGEVCMILNPQDLIRSVRRLNMPVAQQTTLIEEERKRVVLLAEDSITTRIQEKRILEGAGYEVVDAVDGLDAFNKLGHQHVDAVVTDIQMPNMDGLELTKKIRRDKRYEDLPVILVTTLSADEDKRKGLASGANAYIMKAAFEQTVLLDALKRLV